MGWRIPSVCKRGSWRRSARRRRKSLHRFLPRRHSGHDRAFPTAHRFRRPGATRSRNISDAALGGCRLGRRRITASLSSALLAVRIDRHGRESFLNSSRAPHHRPPQNSGVQLVLPRHCGRILYHSERRRVSLASRKYRPARRSINHHQGCGVQ